MIGKTKMPYICTRTPGQRMYGCSIFAASANYKFFKFIVAVSIGLDVDLVP